MVLVMVGRRVVMTLAFYPRGGSAQVVRYLGGALEKLGHGVTVCCGTLGPAGSSSHAETFFAGLDVEALDFTEAEMWFEQGRNPMAAPVPFHPSFEDRPGVPDRVFASLDGDAYHRQVSVWQSLLERVRPPDLYHIHHLTHVNDAVAALGDRPTVVHLHGTELKMLAEIRGSSRGAVEPFGRVGPAFGEGCPPGPSARCHLADRSPAGNRPVGGGPFAHRSRAERC